MLLLVMDHDRRSRELVDPKIKVVALLAASLPAHKPEQLAGAESDVTAFGELPRQMHDRFPDVGMYLGEPAPGERHREAVDAGERLALDVVGVLALETGKKGAGDEIAGHRALVVGPEGELIDLAVFARRLERLQFGFPFGASRPSLGEKTVLLSVRFGCRRGEGRGGLLGHGPVPTGGRTTGCAGTNASAANRFASIGARRISPPPKDCIHVPTWHYP